MRCGLFVKTNIVESRHLEDLIFKASEIFSYKNDYIIACKNIDGEVIWFNLWDVYKSKNRWFVSIAAYRNYLLELYFPAFMVWS